ncbi:MAG TPA: flavodoxin [Firmicutes bacterium]|jgi:hypothetical protein|nr:flavodoxin [Bacillota bacterium]
MKNVVLISASPKMAEQSLSKYLLEILEGMVNSPSLKKNTIDVRKSISHHTTDEDFTILSQADALVIAFPLYFFCLPGILTRFLEDYLNFMKKHEIQSKPMKVYTIVNCGFPEPGINLEAARVIQSFSHHIHAYFRFAIMIGGGGMLLEAKDAPFLKKTWRNLNDAFAKILQDIQSDTFDDIENICISVKFPRRLYFMMGNHNWKSLAKQNGLKKKDLYFTPYQ